ncbi:MAG: DNA polymerase [Candidatus Thorarchaeota archaeon]
MAQAFFLSEAEILQQKVKEEAAKNPKKRRGSRGGGKKSSTPAVYNCESCGLYARCRSPKMKRFGGGKKKILLIGEAPGGNEDRQGRPFVGKAGKFLGSRLKKFGINMDVDCELTNVLRCRPPGNRDPKTVEKKSCRDKLLKDIEEAKPDLIICLGRPSVASLLNCKIIGEPTMTKLHGLVFASSEYNCWIGCSYHPASVSYDSRKSDVFEKDLEHILSYRERHRPKPLDMDGNYHISGAQDAIEFLETVVDVPTPYSFDYETTCFSPYAEGAKLLSVSLSSDPREGFCIYLVNPEWNLVEQAAVYHVFKRFLLSSTPKVVQNFNMEELWSREHVGASINNLVMDTMVTSHVVNCRRGTTSLDFQVYRMTGHYYSGMVNAKEMASESWERLADYNCLDSRYTIMLYQEWQKVLALKENRRLFEFNEFLRRCLFGLANLKERGMPIDQQAMDDSILDCNTSMVAFGKQLSECEAGRRYREEYEDDLNIESPKQLVDLFYGIYQERYSKKTSGGGKSTDSSVLEKLHETTRNRDVKEAIEIIQQYKKKISMRKKLFEYRDVMDPDGRLHPSYNLNTAETYRSSASGPAVQNMFKRDKELIKFRRIIIPSPGNVLGEVDQDGLEMRTAAMVSGDPELTRQIVAGIDSHRRWAARLFDKVPELIDSDERFEAKNSFVFASLYGAKFDSIARNIGMDPGRLEAIQKLFWEEYHYIKEWQMRTLREYEVNGYVESITGFRRPGPLSDEQLFNTPIQGPAFHIVLKGLVEADKILVEDGFQSCLISEIHDSGIFDLHPEEVEDVVDIVTAVMTSELFEWQGGVPLSVTWELGKNFWQMEKI